ncbi:MAG: M15 family metallopeptidase [Spirochaetia bacterium]
MTSKRYEQKARKYWKEQMEAAVAFMEQILDTPARECGEKMVYLPEAADQAGVEALFSKSRLAGRFDRQFYLREGLIGSFLDAAREMNSRGWILKVEDAYRSSAMQKALGQDPGVFEKILKKVIWELDGTVPSSQLMFRRLSVLVATRPKLGTHMSGSALDISVVDRGNGNELDRGGPYLELSQLTPMSSPFVSEAARRNRAQITDIMLSSGFVAYPFEFWHYSQGDLFQTVLGTGNASARYGAINFHPQSGSVVPIDDPFASLHTLSEIEETIQDSLKNLKTE